MVHELSLDKQAHELFFAEAQELYQQVESGLLQLVYEPTLPIFQKILWGVQHIQKGAQYLELTDLTLLSTALESVLKSSEIKITQRQETLSTLPQYFCEGMQLSLRIHHFIINAATMTEQQDFILRSVIPKSLEIWESLLMEIFPTEIYHQLLVQQIQGFQYWHQTIPLPEISSIAEITLKALQDQPQAAKAIASVALAAFQVAHRASLQPGSVKIPTEPVTEITWSDEGGHEINPPVIYPPENSIKTLNISQYLVGLAHHTVFCIATESIAEIVLPQSESKISETGSPQFLWNGHSLPLIQFTDFWEHCQPSYRSALQQTADLILVLKHQPTPLALALEFDRLIVEADLELSQWTDPTTPSPAYHYGWTPLDGNWLEVINVNTLLQKRFSFHPDWSSVTETDSSSSPVQRTSATEATPQTILIVDDSRTIREVLSTTLQDAGYDVLQAQNGQEAIAHLQQQRSIHLTICDIEMSNLNGFEFLRHRLQDEQWLSVPVLILSSHSSPEYRQLAQKLGAADYCTIPYDPGTLLQKIDRLLQGME